MRRYLFVCLLFILSNQVIFGQRQNNSTSNHSIPGAEETRINPDGTIAYVAFHEAAENPFPDWNTFLNKLLNPGESVRFILKSESKDKLGYTHISFTQEINGILVADQILKLHLRDNLVYSLSGEYKEGNQQLPLTPHISQEDAILNGKAHFAELNFSNENHQSQLVYHPMDDQMHLVYAFELEAQKSLVKKKIYVDAISGKVLIAFDLTHSADGEAHTIYNGVQSIITDPDWPGYRLLDYTRNVWTRDLQGNDQGQSSSEIHDSDNIWDEDIYNEDGALDAHWGATVSYDYFLNEHARNSYDNENSWIVSYVDYGLSQSTAVWSGSAMYFGSGAEGDGPLTSLDIVAHELTHGYTQEMAGLNYFNESGALNESFSDIFGVVIDHHVRGAENANFLIGDEALAIPLRNMANPNEFDCADTYEGDFWIDDLGIDNGGVHFNSGVQNYWFYLLCEGGSGTNDNSDTYAVDPIGMEAVADILWRSMEIYLSPSSNFEDSRYYTILSAIDYYGACAPEVIAVTNAWHAVGVGETHNSDIAASFDTETYESCSLPASVQFFNNSINATSYLWDFGDGQTSTEHYPSHLYEESGIYSVRLIAYGEGECDGADTLLLSNLITISPSGTGPMEPSCTPGTQSNWNWYGISSVQFESIHISSDGEIEGYQDYTCEATAYVNAGSAYTLTVELINHSYMSAWIDENNDGIFDNSERIYNGSSEANIVHSPQIIIPEVELYDTPLRLRIRNYNNSNEFYPCQVPEHGQTEDYTVVISESIPSPPICNFDASTNFIFSSNSIQFTNLSQNFPTAFQWTFEGGIPATSTSTNPLVSYETTGAFDVQLIAQNGLGFDTLLIENYINVIEPYNMCESSESTDMAGVLYDSGGPFENYEPNEDCSFLINPPCAEVVHLDWASGNGITWGDAINFYDGPDENSPWLDVVGNYGDIMNLSAYSGQLYITFSSDNSSNYYGWRFIWHSEGTNAPPISNFDLINESIPVNASFVWTDSSTENPDEWLWDFGDGASSTVQNPAHIYTETGIYEVSLTVSNCLGSDTFSQFIEVESGGLNSSTLPDTIFVSLPCGNSETVSLEFSNDGSGDLIISGNPGWKKFETPTIKVPTLYLNDDEMDNLNVFLSIFEDNGFPFEIEQINLAYDEGLIESLNDSDILLYMDSYASDWLREAMLNYVTNGGIAINFGSSYRLHQNWRDTFGLSSFFVLYDQPIYCSELGEEILPDVPTPSLTGVFNIDEGSAYWNNLWVYTSEQEGFHALINAYAPEFNNTVTWIKDAGMGHFINTGSSYTVSNYVNSPVALNLMDHSIYDLVRANWLSFSENDFFVLSSGETTSLEIEIDASEMFPGNYYETLAFESNDSTSPTQEVVIHIELTEEAIIEPLVDPLVFSSTIPGNATTDILIVHNAGCIPLHGAITMDSPAFTSFTDSVHIEPLSSDTVFLSFAPPTPGFHSAEITFNGNFESVTSNLEGQGLEIPEMNTAFGDTLEIQVDCGGAIDTVFYLVNTSLGDLYLSDELRQGYDTLKITYIRRSSEFTNNVRNVVTNDFTWIYSDNFFNLTNAVVSDPNSLDSAYNFVEGSDIIIVPKQVVMQYESHAPYIYLSPLLHDFAQEGGTVIMTGGHELDGADLFPVSAEESYYYGTSFNLISPLHPLVDDVSAPYYSYSRVYIYPFSEDPDVTIIFSKLNKVVVADKTIGEGHIYYIGFDYSDVGSGTYSSDPSDAQILLNALKYAALNTNPSWFDITYVDDHHIAPGDSIAIPISIDADSLTAGIYDHQLIFHTNVPGSENDTLVIRMNLGGQAELLVETTSLDFGDLIVNDMFTISLPFENVKCDTLFSAFNLESEHFYINTLDTFTTGYNTSSMLVTFNPQSIGSLTAELNVTTNGGNETVTLSGNSLIQNQINIMPIDTCNGQYQFDCTHCANGVEALWNFGDGNTSTNYNPTHTYGNGGNYDISMTLLLQPGTSNLVSLDLLVPFQGIQSLNIPDFEAQGVAVEMEVITDVNEEFFWDFGDGSTFEGMETILSHTYEEVGEYTITVSTDNTDVCDNWETWSIDIGYLGIVENDSKIVIVWPNPNDGKFKIRTEAQINIVGIYNAEGRMINYDNVVIGDNEFELNLNNTASGTYYLEVEHKGELSRHRIVVQN